MVDLFVYQGIVFDMDGMLVDFMLLYMVVWECVCNVFGYLFDVDYMNFLGGVFM